MADRFFPQDFETATTPPTVTLNTALYVMRATFFNPITKSDEPLPPHVWFLVQEPPGGGVAQAVSRSTPSDANGICALMDLVSPSAGSFSFVFAPLPPAIRADYFKDAEAWIDLQTTPKNVSAAPKPDWGAAPTPAAAFERRQLLRIPLWSSKRKAPFGGFKSVPTGASTFAKTGTIDSSEVAPFGTPPAPWDIPLDFGWVKAHVKFFFFDWEQNKEQVLPPGLMVEALREPKNNPAAGATRIGAGTALSPNDGTFYLLLEGDPTLFRESQIQLKTPGQSYVDLRTKATPNPDTRLTNTLPIPVNADDRNLLPSVWHSHGMRATFGTGASPTEGSPKIWDQLRSDIAKNAGAADTTLFFRLDDVVLCDSSISPIPIPAKRQSPTLFDHFLTIIKKGPNKPYQSVANLISGIIPANVAYAVGVAPPAGKKVLEVSTRLVHFEGAFHDLRDDRVGGTPGSTLCVGARAAIAGRHVFLQLSGGSPLLTIKNSYEMHVIDVPGVLDPDSKVQLQHLLIYISVVFKPASDFPTGKVPTVQRLLNEAAEHWSAGHPGVPAMQKKRYALLSASPGKRVTRFRAFFAETTNGATLKLKLEKGSADSRASTSESFLFIPETIEYFEAAVDSDNAASSSRTDTGDAQPLSSHTLAHEFGHALGLPDEYGEIVDPAQVVDKTVSFSDPRLSSFSQFDEGFSDWRPFYSDANAMMNTNHLPRLRHFWHHAKTLNTDPTFAKLPDLPYALTHETFAGSGLTFRVPPSDSAPPFQAVFKDVSIPGGHGQCALFPLGDDEGSTETMLRISSALPGPAAAGRVQGILLVRPRLRIAPDTSLLPLDQWTVLQQFHEKIYDRDYISKIRFVLQGGPTFPRIAVFFNPLYAFGTTINPLDSADLTFDLAVAPARPRPNPFLSSKPGTSLRLLASDFAFEPAMRLVLGVPTALPGGKSVDLTPLNPTDIQGLARLVERQLGELPGSRSVGVF